MRIISSNFLIKKSPTIKITGINKVTLQAFGTDDGIPFNLQAEHFATIWYLLAWAPVNSIHHFQGTFQQYIDNRTRRTINKAIVDDLYPSYNVNRNGEVDRTLARAVNVSGIHDNVSLKFEYLVKRFILENWGTHQIKVSRITNAELAKDVYHLYQSLYHSSLIGDINPVVRVEVNVLMEEENEIVNKVTYQINPQARKIMLNDPLHDIMNPTTPLTPLIISTPTASDATME